MSRGRRFVGGLFFVLLSLPSAFLHAQSRVASPSASEALQKSGAYLFHRMEGAFLLSGNLGTGPVANHSGSISYTLTGLAAGFHAGIRYSTFPFAGAGYGNGWFGSGTLGGFWTLEKKLTLGAGIELAAGDSLGISGGRISTGAGLRFDSGDLGPFRESSVGISIAGPSFPWGATLPGSANIRSGTRTTSDLPWTFSLGARATLARTPSRGGSGFSAGFGLGMSTVAFATLGGFASLDFNFGEFTRLGFRWSSGAEPGSALSARNLFPAIEVSFLIPPSEPFIRNYADLDENPGREGAKAASATPGDSSSSPYAENPGPSFLLDLGMGPFDSSNDYFSGSLAALAVQLPSLRPRVVNPEPEVHNTGLAVQSPGKNAGNNTPGAIPSTRPSIVAEYLISPDGNGIRDELVLAIEGAESVPCEAWKFEVRPSGGTTPVYMVASHAPEADPLGILRSFPDPAGRKLPSIDCPDLLVWDGRGTGSSSYKPVGMDGSSHDVVSSEATDATGEAKPVPIVRDGRYEVHFSWKPVGGSWVGLDRPVALVTVDTTPPVAVLQSPGGTIFSPDDDGRIDTLELAMSGDKDVEWELSFLDRENKVILVRLWPAGLLPDRFVWDGKNYAGTIVADGTYSARLTGTDRAGNRGFAQTGNLLVDTVSPKVSLKSDSRFISPNGDGRRDSITLEPGAETEAGLIEWIVKLLDMKGNVLWSESSKNGRLPGIEGRPLFLGKSSNGTVLPDGSYLSVLELKYSNGYKALSEGPVIVIDTVPPVIQITGGPDSGIFSPDGDGKKDSAAWQILVSGAESFMISLLAKGAEPRIIAKYRETDSASLVLDGKDGDGKPLPDGEYRILITAFDEAGNEKRHDTTLVRSDRSRPALSVVAESGIFSPDGDGKYETLPIRLAMEKDQSLLGWALALRSDSGQVLSILKGKSAPTSPRITLNRQLLDSALSASADFKAKGLFPEGIFRVVLSAEYDNGFSGETISEPVEYDTMPPVAKVVSDRMVLDPEAKGERSQIQVSQSGEGGVAWLGDLRTKAGEPVRSWDFGAKLPDMHIIDGKDESDGLLPDGAYLYRLVGMDRAGHRGESAPLAFLVERTPPPAPAPLPVPEPVILPAPAKAPETEVLPEPEPVNSVPPRGSVVVVADSDSFYPSKPGAGGGLGFSIFMDRATDIESWTFSIVDNDRSEKILHVRSGSNVPGKLIWDGRDSSGLVVAGEVRGILRLVFTSGETVEALSDPIQSLVPKPTALVDVVPDGFSPDGDGSKDMLTFRVVISNPDSIASWKLLISEFPVGEGQAEVPAGDAKPFMAYSGAGQPPGSISWNGKSSSGAWVLSGVDYPFVLELVDVTGARISRSGVIPVDIMAVPEGKKIRIILPAIEFGAFRGDFSGLSPRAEARNRSIITRLARVLARYPGMKIRIESHLPNGARSMGLAPERITAEEKESILPLAVSRGYTLRDALVTAGMDIRRFSVVSVGSALPLSDPRDLSARWKNRRFELILE